jgi:hypothetical protein
VKKTADNGRYRDTALQVAEAQVKAKVRLSSEWRLLFVKQLLVTNSCENSEKVD